jgi:hypothetical protein
VSDQGSLFSWDDIPGRDSRQLLYHLEKCVRVSWVKNAEIKKDATNRTVTVTDGKNSLTIKLENVAVLDLGDGETYEYELKREGGKLTVYNKETLFILRELDSGDDEGLRKLANAVSEKSLKDPRALVNVLHSDDEDDSLRAASVILDVGGIAQGPILDALNPDAPERLIWDMQTVVELQVNGRTSIAKNLENMLDDKRPVPLPEPSLSEEEKLVPRRVCDEAYLMMRKLLAFEETEEERFFNTDEFLNKTDVEKDAEIQRARTSKRWIPLAQQFSETEE